MIQKSKTIILAGFTAFFAFSLLFFTDQAFEASIRGLNIWWEVVFPSLLPFFITAELLIAFGVVRFVGVLFEPIMRPLFNVPGAGSFGWIMGMASGYPTGAKIAARLREDDQLTRAEAERLVSFTNSSSPLFIIGAVSIGFFHDAQLGILLAAAHYSGNALVGFCMRFYKKNDRKKTKDQRMGGETNPRVSIVRAFREMHRTRVRDKRPLGEVLGDAVINSIQTLVMIGGFIILFSVLTKLFHLVGVSPIIAGILQHVLALFSLPVELASPFFSGLFEISIGAQMISQISTDTILQKALIVSFILGFNGFSVQAQVASILAKTDIGFAPYFFSRFLHGIFASILTVILYYPLYLNKQTFGGDDIPVSQEASASIWIDILNRLSHIGPAITLVTLGIGAIIIYIKMLRKRL
ncbi:sporulation integral membrane protein YlbJ [Virgibacillus oceani]